jgi:flagellar biogenesis protein FliO
MTSSQSSPREATDGNRSIRRAGVIAGAALLLMSALAGFGYQVAIKGLVTQGSPAKTATDIMAHQSLFRFGILSLILVVALDVVVAWALYRLFKPASKRISMLAAWLRIIYAGIFAVAISQLVEALRLLDNQANADALARINTFTDIWDAGLVLFGLHLLLIAYLAYRSSFVPKLLSVLLAIAGLGYLFDSFGRAAGSSRQVSTVTFIGEFLLALWLVIRVRRIRWSGTESQTV